MQINKINSTQNFGMSIKKNGALDKERIKLSHLQYGLNKNPITSDCINLRKKQEEINHICSNLCKIEKLSNEYGIDVDMFESKKKPKTICFQFSTKQIPNIIQFTDFKYPEITKEVSDSLLKEVLLLKENNGRGSF